MVEELVHLGLLDLAARIHHHHPVGVFGNDAHIVGNQDDGLALGALRLAHEVEDLRLDGDVERGGRLVGDQHLRVAGERHGDHHPLAHAARKLMRIFVRPALRLGDVDLAQHLDGAVHRVAFREALVERDGLANLPADREQRIERGHRLLEDHGNLVAPDILHFGLGRFEEVPSLQPDGAADDAARRARHQAQDRERRHALAAAGFPDDSKGLAPAHAVRDAVHSAHHPVIGEEMRLQILDFENALARSCRGLLSAPLFERFGSVHNRGSLECGGLPRRRTESRRHGSISHPEPQRFRFSRRDTASDFRQGGAVWLAKDS